MDRLFDEKEFAARYGKRLAIVVPYRNREQHLTVFLRRITQYFARDKLDRHIAMSIHVVEQEGTAVFNRGKIKNCGYMLAKDDCDYVCFHDVDYLPVWADYSWAERPCRLAWYGLPLPEDRRTFFGAVVLFDKPAFERVNGYPNAYWGWGYEDGELGRRCKHSLGAFDRRDGTFLALPHQSEGIVTPGVFTEQGERSRALYRSRLPQLERCMAEDGLSSLTFSVLKSAPVMLDGAVLSNAFHHLVDIGKPGV